MRKQGQQKLRAVIVMPLAVSSSHSGYKEILLTKYPNRKLVSGGELSPIPHFGNSLEK